MSTPTPLADLLAAVPSLNTPDQPFTYAVQGRHVVGTWDIVKATSLYPDEVTHLDKDYRLEVELDEDDHTFDHACHQLRSRGHTRATVVPLLFTNAYHHAIDVPNTVAKEDQLDITITPGLGTGPAVAELLRSQIPAGAHPVLYAVGSSRPEANRSVEKLAHTIGGEPLFATRGTTTGRTLDDIRTTHHRVHILPLFVSHGLLLDQLRTHHPPTEHLS